MLIIRKACFKFVLCISHMGYNELVNLTYMHVYFKVSHIMLILSLFVISMENTSAYNMYAIHWLNMLLISNNDNNYTQTTILKTIVDDFSSCKVLREKLQHRRQSYVQACIYSQVSPPTPNALCITIKCVRSIRVDLRVHCMNAMTTQIPPFFIFH